MLIFINIIRCIFDSCWVDETFCLATWWIINLPSRITLERPCFAIATNGWLNQGAAQQVPWTLASPVTTPSIYSCLNAGLLRTQPKGRRTLPDAWVDETLSLLMSLSVRCLLANAAAIALWLVVKLHKKTRMPKTSIRGSILLKSADCILKIRENTTVVAWE